MNNINPSSSPSIEAPHRHSQHNNTVPVILNHDTRLVNRASNLYTRAFKELLTSSRVIMNDIDRLISHHVDHHQTHCAPEVVKALALAEMVVVSTGVSVEATQQSLGNVVSWALHQRSDEVRVLAEQMINDATLLLVKFLREEQQEEEVKAMEVDGEEGVVDQLDLDDVYKHRPVAPPTPAGARPSIVFGVDPNQARNKVAVDYLTVVDYVRTQQTWLDSQRRPPPSTLPAPRLVDVESHPGHSTVNLQSVEAAYPQAVRCGPDSLYIPLFFTGDVANTLLIGLQGELVYVPRDDPRLQFKIFNRINQLPRDKSFLGDVNGDVAPQYRYNPPGSTLYPEVQPWGRTTGHIHQQLALIQFTCHLVANRYRNGADHIGFHHDKTRDFVLGSSVLTVSFGSTRRFELKLLDEKDKKERIKLLLEHGSLFILGPLTNAQYKHSIVQETSKKTDVGERISLTYRNISRFINQTTQEVVETPPAPRLVNVELNPGEAAASSSIVMVPRLMNVELNLGPGSGRRRQALFTRQLIGELFNMGGAVTEERRAELAEFIYNTIIGSGLECKDWGDFVSFQRKFRPQWAKLYDRFKHKEGEGSEPEWACFDTEGQLDFVRNDNIVESFTYPNEYADPDPTYTFPPTAPPQGLVVTPPL